MEEKNIEIQRDQEPSIDLDEENLEYLKEAYKVLHMLDLEWWPVYDSPDYTEPEPPEELQHIWAAFRSLGTLLEKDLCVDCLELRRG